jgi:hypothetical protein
MQFIPETTAYEFVDWRNVLLTKIHKNYIPSASENYHSKLEEKDPFKYNQRVNNKLNHRTLLYGSLLKTISKEKRSDKVVQMIKYFADFIEQYNYNEFFANDYTEYNARLQMYFAEYYLVELN